MNRRELLNGALALSAGATLMPSAVLAQADDTTAGTVAGIISNDRDLDTLASLLIAADLVDALQGAGPFTVFAPVNAAFEALGEATIADLTAEENQDRLRRLLQHHVVPQRIEADGLNAGASLETLAGTTIEITDEDTLLIGDAELMRPDITSPNGVVHKIGAVLQPPEET
ncbi:fasciclin domain-containing protein [Roseivivax marinus]|uniref:fasciclin domain-containing protein n=1 Tax=Roseivivax marinus TaxID=1379903 RepID=UPI00273DE33E|nr:fasciclin domain-containing protein [Roseivivax marinus]